MFRTDLLSIIRSLNTVYTAIGICHASYVDCLLVRSADLASRQFFTKINLRNSASCWLLLQEYITMHSPLNVKYVDLYIFCSYRPNSFLHFVSWNLYTRRKKY